MHDAEIRALFAPLGQVTPAPAILDGRALDEREVLQHVFARHGATPRVDALLTPEQRSLKTGAAHWFVTALDLKVDAAWFTDADLQVMVADLEALHVRTTVEKVFTSAAQTPTRHRLILRLSLVRREQPCPPRQTEVAHGASVGGSEEDLRCDACGALHRLSCGRKGNIGDSRAWTTEYCLACARGVFIIGYHQGYRLQLAEPLSGRDEAG